MIVSEAASMPPMLAPMLAGRAATFTDMPHRDPRVAMAIDREPTGGYLIRVLASAHEDAAWFIHTTIRALQIGTRIRLADGRWWVSDRSLNRLELVMANLMPAEAPSPSTCSTRRCNVRWASI